MHNIRSLLYVQFLQLQLISTFKKSTARKKTLIILGIVFLIIVFGPPTVFSLLGPGLILAVLGFAAKIPAMGVTMASIPLFFLAAVRARLLFSEKDWPLLASLPIPTWKIVCSKFLFLYLLLFGVNIVIMLPQIILMQFFQPAPIAASLFFMLLIMFIVPLIPLILGALLTLGLSRLTNRFNTIDIRQIYALIFALLAIAVLFFQWRAGALNSGSTMLISPTLIVNALDTFMKVYVPSWLLLPQFIASFYLGGSLFILLSLGLFLSFVYFFSNDYGRIHSAVTKKTIIVKKETIKQQRTPRQALIRKEFASLTQFPTLLMNLGFSYLLILIFCGGLLFSDLSTIMQSVQIDMDFNSYIFYAYIMGFLISTLALYAASTLSLEGKHVWIIQTLPLSFHTILHAKLLTSLLLQIIAIVLFSIVLLAKGTLPLTQTFAVILWLLCYACFTSVGNIFFNFILPKYNWKSEVEVIKQSAASFWSTIGNMALLLLFIFISIIPYFATARDSLFLLQMICFVLIAALLFAWLSRQQLYIKAKA